MGVRGLVIHLLAVAFAALTAMGSVLAEPLRKDSPSLSSLFQEAARGGAVPVIVELKLPGRGKNFDDPARQRVVNAAQKDFLNRLFGPSMVERVKARRGVKQMRFVPQLAFSASAAELRRIARDPKVLRVSRNGLNRVNLTETLPLIGVPTVAATGITGTDGIVAVLDTGFQSDHPFLSGKIIAEACFSTTGLLSRYSSSSLCPAGGNSQTGPGAAANCSVATYGGACHHGTHVAGIVAGANTVPGAQPAAGVAKGSPIFAVQVFSHISGVGVLTWDSDIIRGLEHVYARRNDFPGKRIAAVNMSLGGGSYTGTCASDARRPIIQLLRTAGILTVVSAGNSASTNAMSAPACIPEVVSVASSLKSDGISDFSNISAATTVVAPGSAISSSYAGSVYGVMSGTSTPAPHVAGALALLSHAAPSAPPETILAALVETGAPLSDTRSGGLYTKPRIKVDSALQALMGGSKALAVAPTSPVIIERLQTGVTPSGFGFTLSATVKGATLPWELTGLPAWLQADKTSGVATNTATAITISVTPPPVQTADLSALLSFNQPGSGKPAITIPVTLKYVAQRLVLVPEQKRIVRNIGGRQASPPRFSIAASMNVGTGTWQLSGVPSWLKPSATSGGLTTTPTTLQFTVDPRGIVGNRQARLVLSLAGTGQSKSLPVVLDYVPQRLKARPLRSPAIGWKNGALVPSKLSIHLAVNSGSAKWRLAGLPNWLKASAMTGDVNAQGSSLTLRVQPPAGQKKTLTARLKFFINGEPALQDELQVTLAPKPAR